MDSAHSSPPSALSAAIDGTNEAALEEAISSAQTAIAGLVQAVHVAKRKQLQLRRRSRGARDDLTRGDQPPVTAVTRAVNNGATTRPIHAAYSAAYPAALGLAGRPPASASPASAAAPFHAGVSGFVPGSNAFPGASGRYFLPPHFISDDNRAASCGGGGGAMGAAGAALSGGGSMWSPVIPVPPAFAAGFHMLPPPGVPFAAPPPAAAALAAFCGFGGAAAPAPSGTPASPAPLGEKRRRGRPRGSGAGNKRSKTTAVVAVAVVGGEKPQVTTATATGSGSGRTLSGGRKSRGGDNRASKHFKRFESPADSGSGANGGSGGSGSGGGGSGAAESAESEISAPTITAADVALGTPEAMRVPGSIGAGGVAYKGVRQRRWGKWVTEIREPSRRSRIWLGSFDSWEDAARVYDMAAWLLRGPKAQLNFPPPTNEKSCRPAAATAAADATAAAAEGSPDKTPPALLPVLMPAATAEALLTAARGCATWQGAEDAIAELAAVLKAVEGEGGMVEVTGGAAARRFAAGEWIEEPVGDGEEESGAVECGAVGVQESDLEAALKPLLAGVDGGKSSESGSEKSTEPCNSEKSTEPCNSEKSTEPCNSEKSTEPCNSEKSTEPCNSEKSTEPCSSEKSTEPCDSEKSNEPCNSEKSAEPCNSEKSTEPCTSFSGSDDGNDSNDGNDCNGGTDGHGGIDRLDSLDSLESFLESSIGNPDPEADAHAGSTARSAFSFWLDGDCELDCMPSLLQEASQDEAMMMMGMGMGMGMEPGTGAFQQLSEFTLWDL
ncbi:unnamed protein product [Closterium sp. NIES-53]